MTNAIIPTVREQARRWTSRRAKDTDEPPRGRETLDRRDLSKRPLLILTNGRDVPATVRRLIEVANGAGANLRHHNGHTLVDWNKVRRWSAFLIAAWPLVDAHMAGKPLQCAYEHKGAPPLADTLDPVGNPTCNACVGVVTNARI